MERRVGPRAVEMRVLRERKREGQAGLGSTMVSATRDLRWLILWTELPSSM